MVPVLDRILESGESFGLKLAGSRALMSLRLEKAFPSWGLELSSDYSPWSTSLARFVKTDKGEFIGRDAALELKKANGAVRSAVLTVDAMDADAVGGEAIYCDGAFAGYASSGGYGYAVEKSLALAYLKPDMIRPGAPYEIEIIGERSPAQLVMEPPYDPSGSKMRG
jgi:dimethylglycine dehydrogenase